MTHLIARVDAPSEVRAFPLRLRRALRDLHNKYYRLTFYKANRFTDAVPTLPRDGGSLGGYAVVFSPRFNHIGLYWDTSSLPASDVLALNMYLTELFALLTRHGYTVGTTNPLRRIHAVDGEDPPITYLLISFGSPTLFFEYDS